MHAPAPVLRSSKSLKRVGLEGVPQQAQWLTLSAVAMAAPLSPKGHLQPVQVSRPAAQCLQAIKMQIPAAQTPAGKDSLIVARVVAKTW